jgi:signal transduction histidine kinase
VRLQTRWAVVLIVVALLLSSTIYGGLELYKQQELDRSHNAAEESAAMAAAQIESALDERRDYIGYVASKAGADGFTNTERLIDGVVDNSRFFAVQIVNMNGTVVAFDGQINNDVRTATVGSNVSDEAYVTRARTEGASVTDPEYVDQREQYLVVVSAPITVNGSVAGILAASIYISDDTFLSTVKPLAREDQRVSVQAGTETIFESREPFGQAVVGRDRAEPYGWVVTVERDAAPLDARIRMLGLAQGVGLVLVLLLVGLLWLIEHRLTVRQTQRLLDGFAALREGAYDHTIQLESAEEWHRISDRFNALAAALGDRETAIREREQRMAVLNRVLRHNVRNEMNVILGYAEVIAENAARDDIRRSAETIRRRGNRLVQVSDQARWLGQQLDVEDPQTVDLAAEAEDIVTEVAAEHPEATVSLSAPDSVHVRAVPQIGIAIQNLVENACVHHDGTPTVEVQIETDSDEAHLSVADDGPGIPTQELSVLQSGEETPLEHGSGLGLWVTKWLVDRSGGTIDFRENDPHGSVVILRLPLHEG